MSARIWLLRRDNKRMRRVWGNKINVESDAFSAACRRLSDACNERDRLVRLGRLGRYFYRRLVVELAS